MKKAIVEALSLSAKTQALIDDVRPGFTSYVSDLSEVLSTRKELAPRFGKAFDAFRDETKQSFVAFVRLLDPSVPKERDDYRNHASYQAAQYLRRLLSAPKRSKRGPKAATPLIALARLVATVLPVVDRDGAIWTAFVAEMHWSERQASRVQALAGKLHGVPMPRKAATLLKHVAAAA